MILQPDLNKRKQILSRICEKDKKWKCKKGIRSLWNGIAVAIIIGIAVFLILNHASVFGMMLFLTLAVLLSLIPFLIGRICFQHSMYSMALPYSSYANGTLSLNGDIMEYTFWRVEMDEPGAWGCRYAVYKDSQRSAFVIRKRDIDSVKIDDGICTITGKGVLEEPMWGMGCARFISCENFSFLMAFKGWGAAGKIKEWMEMNNL